MKYKNKNGIGLSYEGHENDNSVQLVKEVISLPMHSELSIDQIEYICDKILCFFD